MRTKQERRNSEIKELIKRMKNCKSAHGYDDGDNEYIVRKSDIPHSHGSNYWNAYNTKSMRNKRLRLKMKTDIQKEMENQY